MNKKKTVKTSSSAVILKADRSLFGRIIVMAENRNLQMAQILAHPLGPLPWSLATPDGQLRKTNKAALAAHFNMLKKMSTPVKHPPNHGRMHMATVIDGMSLVQKISGNQTTFGEIAASIFNMALKDTPKFKS
jgi:hypothetical protein